MFWKITVEISSSIDFKIQIQDFLALKVYWFFIKNFWILTKSKIKLEFIWLHFKFSVRVILIFQSSPRVTNQIVSSNVPISDFENCIFNHFFSRILQIGLTDVPMAIHYSFARNDCFYHRTTLFPKLCYPKKSFKNKVNKSISQNIKFYQLYIKRWWDPDILL